MEWLIGIVLTVVLATVLSVAIGLYSSHRQRKIEQRKDTFAHLRRMWRLGCGVVSYDVAKPHLPPWLPTLVEAPDNQVEEMIEKLARDFSIVP